MPPPLIVSDAGPLISVDDAVFAGQSNHLIFPPILSAPSGGGDVIGDPAGADAAGPKDFGGG